MKIVVRGIEPHEIDVLLDFMTDSFGSGCYQSQRRYFDWLYERNPATRGIEDCIVALDGSEIVGCVHRMRLPFIIDGRHTTMVSLQNHVISPRIRGGAGIMLLQKAVRGEEVSFSPGVAGRLGEAYRRLGYNEIPSYWFMRGLSPVRAAVQVGWARLLRGKTAEARIASGSITNAGLPGTTVTATPDPQQLCRLAAGMESQQKGGQYVPWTVEMLRWRYFSPDGPLHLFLEQRDTDARAVISFGNRSGVDVVRLVEYQPGADTGFMKEVLKVARRIGGAVALGYSTRPEFRDQLLSGGWKPRKDPPSSFSIGSDGLSVSAAATDVGLEAISTRVC